MKATFEMSDFAQRLGKTLCTVALFAAMVTIADAGTMVISSITTSPAFQAAGTDNHTLTEITDGGGTFSNLSFATVSNAPDENNITYGVAGTAPASANAALSDPLVDTGKLSTGAGTIFEVTPTDATDKLFIIFNASTSAGFYQGPGQVTARDTNGDAIGTPVTVNVDNDGLSSASDAVVLGDQFTDADLARVGAGTLFDRLLLGVTIDALDFGVSDLSTIAGFTISGELEPGAAFADSFDVQTVGLASIIPEPACLVLLGLGGLAIALVRRVA